MLDLRIGGSQICTGFEILVECGYFYLLSDRSNCFYNESRITEPNNHGRTIRQDRIPDQDSSGIS